MGEHDTTSYAAYAASVNHCFDSAYAALIDSSSAPGPSWCGLPAFWLGSPSTGGGSDPRTAALLASSSARLLGGALLGQFPQLQPADNVHRERARPPSETLQITAAPHIDTLAPSPEAQPGVVKRKRGRPKGRKRLLAEAAAAAAAAAAGAAGGALPSLADDMEQLGGSALETRSERAALHQSPGSGSPDSVTASPVVRGRRALSRALASSHAASRQLELGGGTPAPSPRTYAMRPRTTERAPPPRVRPLGRGVRHSARLLGLERDGGAHQGGNTALGVQCVELQPLGEGEERCSICWEPVGPATPSQTRLVPCHHAFHEACITPWLQAQNTCPQCRVRVTHRTAIALDMDCEPEAGAAQDAMMAPPPQPQPADEQLVSVPHSDAFRASVLPNGGHLPYDDTVCQVCHDGGCEDVLLLCDGCDAGFHTHCVQLAAVPRGAWHCRRCRREAMLSATEALILLD